MLHGTFAHLFRLFQIEVKKISSLLPFHLVNTIGKSPNWSLSRDCNIFAENSIVTTLQYDDFINGLFLLLYIAHISANN